MGGREHESLLLCYVEGDPSADDLASVHAIIRRVSGRAGWAIAAPELVNEGDDEDWTAGVLLRLPGPGQPAGQDKERQALSDVERLVDAAVAVTRGSDLDLAFELDGEVVGYVANGEADRMLVEGLLSPWRNRIALR